ILGLPRCTGWALRRAAVVVMTLVGACTAQVPDVRVSLYSQQPPNRLTVSSASGGARWKVCPTCNEMRIDAPITIEVMSGGLKATGQPGSYPTLYFTGNYRLTSSQHPAFEGAYPLELSAHNNALQLIANLPLEEYVAAVLAGESGNQQSDQSLQ